MILQCTAGSVCKKTCAGDELDCYILDDNGFIILSEDASQTGRFFGQVDGTIMDSLVQDRIYKKVTVHDHQGRCPDSRNPFSGASNTLSPIRPLSWLSGYIFNLVAVWYPLWETAHARSHAEEELGINISFIIILTSIIANFYILSVTTDLIIIVLVIIFCVR